ncbi:MAG: response regulator [Bdellovibrionales bacterium]|nr:response regulator [Bdellovibrionales bacterium]
MKILIVEDDETNRKLLERFLSPFGEIRHAHCGQSALERFKEAHQADSPFDLICLDIMMPELDGHTVLKAIRSYETEFGKEGAKVIMTTSLDDSSNVLGAFKSGCEAYVVKPIDRQTLIHEMQKLGLVAGEPALAERR